MGLSERKTKQRIGHDPRNLTWADDAAKFGASYLSKFGWDSSKGLGAEGDGRLSHIKVSQKLDMMGIGAAHQRDPNGIAWKQNKDFERLLERLNADATPEVKEEPVPDALAEEYKKRKRQDGDEPAVKKKRRKSEPVTEAEVVGAVEAVKPVVPRHRAHRARAIAAKNIASKSAAAIAEILGVAPTAASDVSTPTASPNGSVTPCGDDVTLEKLTTSTKSVSDYFKDKLLAKAGKSGSVVTTPSDAIKSEIDYDAPRGGLGSSRVQFAVKEESVEPPARIGLGGFKSSMMASFFSASSTLPVAKESSAEVKDEKAVSDTADTGKRTDKKGKRRSVDQSEVAITETSGKNKRQKHREDAEDASNADAVDEEETKRAKKERKRLKALKKEQKTKDEEEPQVK
ncbi:G-patch domain-containing protein, partial [Favolaschia claudopus]